MLQVALLVVLAWLSTPAQAAALDALQNGCRTVYEIYRDDCVGRRAYYLRDLPRLSQDLLNYHAGAYRGDQLLAACRLAAAGRAPLDYDAFAVGICTTPAAGYSGASLATMAGSYELGCNQSGPTLARQGRPALAVAGVCGELAWGDTFFGEWVSVTPLFYDRETPPFGFHLLLQLGRSAYLLASPRLAGRPAFMERADELLLLGPGGRPELSVGRHGRAVWLVPPYGEVGLERLP